MNSGGNDSVNTLFLNIGLNNGVLLRSVLDNVNGVLTDTRTRFLGTKGVKLLKIKVKGTNAILALSRFTFFFNAFFKKISQTWIGYYFQSKYQMIPLSYVPLEFASTFSSEQCPEGIVAISSNTLRIFTIERLGEMFNQTVIPLLHTPRKCIIHPNTNYLIIIETGIDKY